MPPQTTSPDSDLAFWLAVAQAQAQLRAFFEYLKP